MEITKNEALIGEYKKRAAEIVSRMTLEEEVSQVYDYFGL